MTRYLVQPRDRIFVKGYGFLSFAKNMGKSIGKNISKSLNSKYSQRPLDPAKQSATNAFKSKINGRLITIYHHGISKNNKSIRRYNKSTI